MSVEKKMNFASRRFLKAREKRIIQITSGLLVNVPFVLYAHSSQKTWSQEVFQLFLVAGIDIFINL